MRRNEHFDETEICLVYKIRNRLLIRTEEEVSDIFGFLLKIFGIKGMFWWNLLHGPVGLQGKTFTPPHHDNLTLTEVGWG
jgi:hypothetical protein